MSAAPSLTGSHFAGPGPAEGLGQDDHRHCGLHNVCLPPPVVGATLHAANCLIGRSFIQRKRKSKVLL